MLGKLGIEPRTEPPASEEPCRGEFVPLPLTLTLGLPLEPEARLAPPPPPPPPAAAPLSAKCRATPMFSALGSIEVFVSLMGVFAPLVFRLLPTPIPIRIATLCEEVSGDQSV